MVRLHIHLANDETVNPVGTLGDKPTNAVLFNAHNSTTNQTNIKHGPIQQTEKMANSNMKLL